MALRGEDRATTGVLHMDARIHWRRVVCKRNFTPLFRSRLILTANSLIMFTRHDYCLVVTKIVWVPVAMTNMNLRLARSVAAALIAVSVQTAFPGAGHAILIDPARYCSAGANPSITGDTVAGSLLSVNDVTLTITSPPNPQYIASNCYGDFDPGRSSPDNETSALNDIFGPGLLYLDKADTPDEASSPTGLGGITFIVGTSGGTNGAPGTWTVTWTDSNGANPLNVPITVDLAVLLNGGNNNAAYLLSSVFLPLSPTTGTGTFDIQFLNDGSNQPGISHLTLAGRIIPTTNVPEPSTLAIFGAGLLGLVSLRRRFSRP